jgi:hypothetical protein
MKKTFLVHLIAFTAVAAWPMAAWAGSLTDLGAIKATSLSNPGGNGVRQWYDVDVSKDGKLVGSTDSSGNAFIWTSAGGIVTIGSGYSVVGTDWYTNANGTALVIANNWGNAVTRPWYWQGNADGSGGVWTQLPGAGQSTSTRGYWFGTSLGVKADNSDWWVGGYTTNTSASCTPNYAKQMVGYDSASATAANPVIVKFSNQQNGGHFHGAFFGVSDTGMFVGNEEYSGSCPGTGSYNGHYWQWQPASVGSRCIYLGPPEAGDGTKVSTSYTSMAGAISGDGTIKGGMDKSTTPQVALWWDNNGLVHKVPQYLINGTTPSAYMAILSLNRDGTVMGGFYYRSDQGNTWWEALFCVRSGTTFTSTNAVSDVLSAYGINTNGWTFTEVTGMSYDGNVIAGWGTNSGAVHGWVAQLLTVAVQTTNPTCGNSDGSIQVTASGVPNYQFSKDGGATWTAAQASGIYTFSGLPAGAYSIKAKDAYGYAVNCPGNPVILGTFISSVTSSNISCNGANDGWITVTAPSGAGPLQFSDDGGANWTAGTSPYTFSGLAGGTYNIQVQDANQCTVTYSGNPITIIDPPAVTISTVNSANSTCGGRTNGSITVTASGGTGALQFTDDNGTTWKAGTSPYSFSGLPPGNYYIGVRDTNLCTVYYGSNPVTITEPAASVAISDVSSVNVTCGGGNSGSITVTASGTGTLRFSDNGGTNWTAGTSPYTFSSLAAGSYLVEVQDDDGCTYYAGNPVILTQPAVLTASAAPNTNICLGDSYALNGSASGGNGGYSYSWLPTTGLDDPSIANPTASPTSTTLYTLTVTDALSCTAQAQVTVTVHSCLGSVTISNIVGNTLTYGGGGGARFILLKSTDVAAPLGGWEHVHTNLATPGTFTIPAVGTGTTVFYSIKSE